MGNGEMGAALGAAHPGASRENLFYIEEKRG